MQPGEVGFGYLVSGFHRIADHTHKRKHALFIPGMVQGFTSSGFGALVGASGAGAWMPRLSYSSRRSRR